MNTLALVGAQWGDEGKGKIIDILAEKADMVVRAQGGNNAGHTVVTGGVTYKLHLVPSGILYPDTVCVIGNGTVVDPAVLLEELDDLSAKGIDCSRLKIDARAHVILPYHIVLDELSEDARGKADIGTTKKGSARATWTRRSASASACAISSARTFSARNSGATSRSRTI